MPSSDEAQRLRDIVENIDNALAYVGTRSHADFAGDQMRIDAVERCIERMAEAMIKIGELRMAEIAPDIPLPALRQLGNILRHEYGEVDLRLIYSIVVERMPVLRAACIGALSDVER
jgi:uncharacterized protein with HEPN domain